MEVFYTSFIILEINWKKILTPWENLLMNEEFLLRYGLNLLLNKL
jgi:hypothetical protein